MAHNANPLHVLIADDQSAVRSALRLLLIQEPGATTIDEACDLDEICGLDQELRPDLVLLDWELPNQGGCAALAQVRATWPGATVIALSGLPEARQAALTAGADAFVSKGDPPEQLMKAVRRCRAMARPRAGLSV
jgi:DNA-binding NarL/FixJ family response regulator